MNYIKDHDNLNNTKILLRLDLNVPLKNGVITDQTRIDKILPIFFPTTFVKLASTMEDAGL